MTNGVNHLDKLFQPVRAAKYLVISLLQCSWPALKLLFGTQGRPGTSRYQPYCSALNSIAVAYISIAASRVEKCGLQADLFQIII